jgi:NADH-quinone oxidoreductase subunit F
MFVEGLVIGCYALDCHLTYVYCRGEFRKSATARLQQAIDEAYAQGYLGKDILGSGFDLDMHVVIGAGAYICGEETALLESLEGRKGYPRLKPPFPANAGGGLFKQPTAVNNVETLANLPVIVEKGGDWFSSVGVPKNGGTRLYAASGHVNTPGVHEAPMGTTFRVLLDEYCGGMRGNKKLKAIIPGGSSSAVMTAEEVDWPSDFDTLKAKKTMAGSGGVVYLDEDTNMAFALANVMRFYAHESCGQCTPCREGTAWLSRLLDKICAGRGEKLDVDNVHQIARQMEMKTICALADGAAMPAKSYIEKFRADFDALVRG